MEWHGVRVPLKTPFFSGIAQGTVSAAKVVAVTVAGLTVNCLADRGVTTAAGDIVYGRRMNGYLLVEGRMYGAAPAGSTELNSYPPGEDALRFGKGVLRPYQTATYFVGSGWRTSSDDVYQGEYGPSDTRNRRGCIFYDKRPRAFKGVTVTSATMKVKRLEGGRPDSIRRHATFRQVSEIHRPQVNNATLQADTTSGPYLRQGDSTDWAIPTSWVDDLISGNCGGFCIWTTDGDPYIKLAGRSSWSPAFTITFNWKRVS
jgi:hypothetical protein